VAACLGYRCGGRTESCQGVEGSIGRHQRVFVGATAALPSDAEHNLGREELHHHLSDADRVSQLRRAVDVAARTAERSRRRRLMTNGGGVE